MKNKLLKGPILSTSFSENKESAKRRFRNILSERKKTGVVFLLGFIVLIMEIGAFITIKYTEKTEEPLKNTEEIKKQLEYIAENINLWADGIRDEYNTYFYAVTDLDHNGRLEIISSSVQGTGMYTYSNIYEVNKTLDGFVKIETNLQEMDSQVDMIVEQVKVFYDVTNEEYHYIFNDLIKNGAAEYFEQKRDLLMKEERIIDAALAYKSTIYTNGIPKTEYLNAMQNKITEKEYETIEERLFEDLEAKVVTFQWIKQEEILNDTVSQLTNSYDIFSNGVKNSSFDTDGNGNDSETKQERRKAYAEELMSLIEEGELSELAKDYPVSDNSFTIMDIDFDGKEELIVFWTSSIVAGQVATIYEYNIDTKEWIEELKEFPLLTFYDTGVVEALMSHNQGLAGENFWPYTLYVFEPSQNRYNKIGLVDAWDKSIREEDYDGTKFPDDVDQDGDGMVYYIMTGEEYKRDNPIDKAEYETWRNTYIRNGGKMNVPSYKLTRENIKLFE